MYKANRRGVKLGDKRYPLGAEIPEQDSVQFRRYVRRGWIVWEEDDFEAMTKAQLEEIAAERGLEVEGTGADGGVLKDDLIRALEGGG